MEEIGAYEKFPMKVPLSQRVEELKEILEHNYAAYTASWADMSREELIKNSQEIAAVRSAYSFMMDDFPFDPAEVNNLLKLKDPLFFLADRWLLPMEDPSFVHDILEVLSDPQCLKKYIANTPPQAKKPSVRKQLRNAVQTPSQRPPAGHKHPGEDAR